MTSVTPGGTARTRLVRLGESDDEESETDVVGGLDDNAELLAQRGYCASDDEDDEEGY